MPDLTTALEEAISATERLRKSLARNQSRQVNSAEERAIVKATSLAWFNAQRPPLAPLSDDALLRSIDLGFQQLLEFSDSSTSRVRYRSHLKTLKAELVKFRSQADTVG